MPRFKSCVQSALVAASAVMIMFSSHAQAGVVLNEIFASGPGSDLEFFEIYNSGPAAVDIEGYFILGYESDFDNPNFGNLDHNVGITGPNTLLQPGDFYLITSEAFENSADPLGGFAGDQSVGNNNVENSSVTLLLADNLGTTLHSVFLSDNGAGDAANIAGSAITPDTTVLGPGTFSPAGFELEPDGDVNGAILLPFSNDAGNYTPGFSNVIPEPSTIALLFVAGVGMLAKRRNEN